MNAISYLRVSTKEQVEDGNSLVTQETKCRQKASTTDYQLIKLFSDEGESAKTANRPGLLSLIEYCRKNYKNIDAIIVYKIDRLARNTEDYTALRALFKKLGIKIISVMENIEESASGKFLETVLAAAAEFDNDNRAENCRNGMVTAVKEGRWVWKAPIGFKNVRVDGKGTIEPIETYQSLILKAFELLATGHYRPEEVRKMMDKEGLKDAKDKSITKNRFLDLIRNPVYAGIIEAFGLSVQGKYPLAPMISAELFYKVQDILDGKHKKAPSYKKDHPDFPLRGLLICECGSRFTGSWSRGRKAKYANYRCQSCTGKGTNKAKRKIENQFKVFISSFEYTPEFSSLLKKAILFNWHKRNEEAVAKSIKIDQQIEELREKQKAVAEKNALGVTPDQLARDMIEGYDQNIKSLLGERAEIQTGEGEIEVIADYGTNFMQTIADRWDKAELPEKQRFQNFFFPAGLIYTKSEKFGTASPLLLVQLKKTFHEEKSLLVDQSGLELALRLTY